MGSRLISLTRVQLLQRARIASMGDRNCSIRDMTSLTFTSERLEEHPIQRWQRPIFHVDYEPFASLLRQCAETKDLLHGKRIHDQIINIGCEQDMCFGSLLVQMYGNCGALEDARESFAVLPYHDHFSWNFLITAYARHGQGKEALLLFNQMQQEGTVPNQFVVPSIFSACADQVALTDGKCMHARIKCSRFESDVAVGNAIVNMYGKCNSLEDARRMFDTMVDKNTFSWTTMIAGYAQHGQGKVALHLFDQMQQEAILPNNATFASIFCACASHTVLYVIKCMHSRIAGSSFQADVTVGNALINMYGKCGSLGDASKIFHKMPKQNTPSWNALITAYVYHEQGLTAFQLFHQMEQEGVLPNRVTLISILSACAGQAALSEGKRIHAWILRSGWELDIVVSNALLNMYAKCGTLEETWQMFAQMPELDAVSWSAIITASAQHGQGKQAFQLFDKMQRGGVIPNEVTFLSILSACSHAGMVDEAYHWFLSMKNSPSITPLVYHYNCMVDLLGRAGRLSEAEALISSMPCQATFISWMTLLGACRNLGDVERGKRAANHVLKLHPQNATPYVMLSNICAVAGQGLVQQR